MNSRPENSINSTSSTKSDVNTFPFLKKWYTKGFFSRFINGYFLLLLEDCNRFKWNADEYFDKFFAMVFNPELVDDKCYSRYLLQSLIYDDPQMLKQSNELTILDSADRFLLCSKYTWMHKLNFDREEIKNELFRQAGLLVIHARMNYSKPSQPQFIAVTKSGVDFCDTAIIKDSLLKYKAECTDALERVDKVKPCGRIYSPIVNEYFGFLGFTIKKFHNLLTYELKDVLNKWYQQYKQDKIEFGKETGNP